MSQLLMAHLSAFSIVADRSVTTLAHLRWCIRCLLELLLLPLAGVEIMNFADALILQDHSKSASPIEC